MLTAINPRCNDNTQLSKTFYQESVRQVRGRNPEQLSIDTRNRQSNHSGQSQRKQIIQSTSRAQKQIRIVMAKHAKTSASELRLFLAFLLIGWQSGPSC